MVNKTISSLVNPKDKINIEIEAFSNGTLYINNNGKIFNSKTFKKDLQKELQGMNKHLKETLGNIGKGIDSKLRGMEKTLANEMKNLQSNLGNLGNDLPNNFN